MAAWCRMELLIQVTPDIPLWVGLREGGGLGRAKFRTRLNPSATQQPWPEGVSPLPPPLAHLKTGCCDGELSSSTQGASHSAQHIASAQTPQVVIAELGSAGASRVVDS